ncbi:MAG: hypothetical protein KDA75_17290 [Planctomycetaceae bacterium]|nr:hypothetical protein [Planctomycetaceae bacterium]
MGGSQAGASTIALVCHLRALFLERDVVLRESLQELLSLTHDLFFGVDRWEAAAGEKGVRKKVEFEWVSVFGMALAAAGTLSEWSLVERLLRVPEPGDIRSHLATQWWDEWDLYLIR